MTSATKDDTILPNAPPMITPTAMSITFPFKANALKSCNKVLFPISIILCNCVGKGTHKYALFVQFHTEKTTCHTLFDRKLPLKCLVILAAFAYFCGEFKNTDK